MIDHLGITVSSIAISKLFYVKTLSAHGYRLIRDTPSSISFGILDIGHGQSTDPGGEFWLSEGQPIKPLAHIAFSATSRTIVDRFFADGLSAGGMDNGAPKLRARYHQNYYAAYLLDPDGYNIEAGCHAAFA